MDDRGDGHALRLLATCLALCVAADWAHAATPAAAALAAVAPPKLVVVLVVDGLPNEQVQRYRDQFGQGGFRRLLDQGAAFSNAHQAHGITVTAIGHSATMAQMAMTRAYRLGKTLVVANLQYTGIVFSSFWGVVIFGDLFDADVGPVRFRSGAGPA